VDKLIALYNDGFGTSRAGSHRLVFGPLFKDGAKDAIVLFTIAGQGLTNGHREYIAIFAQGEGRSTPIAKETPYRLIASTQIGGRWTRTFDLKTAKISSGLIALRGFRWRDKDPGCCPSGRIQLSLEIDDSAGTETRYPILREVEINL